MYSTKTYLNHFKQANTSYLVAMLMFYEPIYIYIPINPHEQDVTQSVFK